MSIPTDAGQTSVSLTGVFQTSDVASTAVAYLSGLLTCLLLASKICSLNIVRIWGEFKVSLKSGTSFKVLLSQTILTPNLSMHWLIFSDHKCQISAVKHGEKKLASVVSDSLNVIKSRESCG